MAPLPIRRRALPVLLLPLSTPRPAAAQPQRATVGHVTAVAGGAFARSGVHPARRLEPGGALWPDDLLTTDADGRLSCRLATGVELRLGGNASLRLDRVAPGGARPGTALSVDAGPLLLSHQHDAEDAAAAAAARRPARPIVLDLPWARIAVRGTRVFVGPLDDVFAVFVARGLVDVTLADGWRGPLSAGEGLDVQRRAGVGPLHVVNRWGPARVARALALVE